MRNVSDKRCGGGKTILCAIFFVEKYDTAMRATDGGMIRHTDDAICMPHNYGKTTDTHTHTQNM